MCGHGWHERPTIQGHPTHFPTHCQAQMMGCLHQHHCPSATATAVGFAVVDAVVAAARPARGVRIICAEAIALSSFNWNPQNDSLVIHHNRVWTSILKLTHTAWLHFLGVTTVGRVPFFITTCWSMCLLSLFSMRARACAYACACIPACMRVCVRVCKCIVCVCVCV